VRREPNRETQLGDALQWLAFLVPWCAFALYAHVALARKLGVVGVLEASCVCVAALPFWRAACRRPAFQPLAALLARFHAKRRLRPFEETRAEARARAGARLTDWRVGFEKSVPDARAELAAFVATLSREEEETRDERRGFPASDARLAPTRDVNGLPRRRRRESSDGESARDRARDPASRLAAAGFRVFPLCDASLVKPNAAAARHFPATCAAVRAAGGFGARLWVLSPETNHAGARTRGVSDGYWRAHVVLDADEAEVDDASATRDAAREKLGDGDSDVGESRETLGDFAGIRVGDETRGVEIGEPIVVNDAFERAWFHENRRARLGANGRVSSSRETVSSRNVSRKKTSRAGAAVVLTFDVLRPEHAACRVLYVRHKAWLVREAGERNAGERTWRSLALAMLGNLS
jgi:hypothetical protein